MKDLSIEIAGGGASAALVLSHLARHRNAEKIVNIIIFDDRGRFAEGVAYSTKNPLHLLNVRAANMSAVQDDPAHFTLWLSKNRYRYDGMDFVPRMIYARYLKSMWDDAVRILGSKIILKAEKFKASGAPVRVIATGNAYPVLLPGADELMLHDGYHASPWHMDCTSLNGHIVIAGTGLSMIDTVMALHGAGFKGQVSAVSRHGLIPTAHAEPAVYPCYYDRGFPTTSLGLLKDLRVHAEAAERQGLPWQSVIDSLRPVTNAIWSSLDERQKRNVRRFSAFWNIHRHRMAPVAVGIVREWQKSGQLRIIKDRIIRIEKTADEEQITVIGSKRAYKADYVVNCLGYKSDPDLKYDIEHEKSGIYALGPALSGIYFETTAIPEIRVQAGRIADEILR